LAIGSSLLPWAHTKFAVHLEPVKGLVGPDDGGVCSTPISEAGKIIKPRTAVRVSGR
jgi:hypothetical protein